MKIKIKVLAQWDSAGPMKWGTLEIDRDTGFVTGRPLRSRTTYHDRLGNMVDRMIQGQLKVQAYDKARTKAGK